MGLLAKPLEKKLAKPSCLPKLNRVVSHDATQPIPVKMMHELQRRMMAVKPEQDGTDMTGHMFCEGLYSRQYFLPKGRMGISLVHARQNFFVVISGECLIGSPEGTTHIKAPYMTVTQPGTKRAIYALEDTVYVTFHANPDNETDLLALEQRHTIPEPGVPRDLSIRHSTNKVIA